MIIKRFVNSVFDSNTYILSKEQDKNCWLVDCGDAEVLIDWIKINNKKLNGVFVTHSHFDHIYGLNRVVEAFPSCIIYTSQRGKEGLFSDRLNISRYHCDSYVYKYNNVSILKNGDSVELFSNVLMKVITTPGHDESCFTFVSGAHIFTGDSFLPDYKVITNFPKSDKVQANKSLRKIKNAIKSGAKNVYPGHGDIKVSFNPDDLLIN
mgnify:FL=1